MDHGDHDPPWWTRSVQDHLGPHSNIFLIQSKPIKPVMCPKGVICAKPMTHNYELCVKYINHMTTIVSHATKQPITIAQ